MHSAVGDAICPKTVTSGCPIRKSPDQCSFDNSPGLIAAYHVLHRFLAPRHPPCTLRSLTTTISPCQTPKVRSDGLKSLSNSSRTLYIAWTPSKDPMMRTQCLVTADRGRSALPLIQQFTCQRTITAKGNPFTRPEYTGNIFIRACCHSARCFQ